MIEVLTNVIALLNAVDVRGKVNMRLMYNAIDTLEQLKKAYTMDSDVKEIKKEVDTVNEPCTES
jgi:DNA-binding protein